MTARTASVVGNPDLSLLIPNLDPGLDYYHGCQIIRRLLIPIAYDGIVIYTKNLPAAIAILRFNGIEVEVEK